MLPERKSLDLLMLSTYDDTANHSNGYNRLQKVSFYRDHIHIAVSAKSSYPAAFFECGFTPDPQPVQKGVRPIFCVNGVSFN